MCRLLTAACYLLYSAMALVYDVVAELDCNHILHQTDLLHDLRHKYQLRTLGAAFNYCQAQLQLQLQL